MPNCYELQLSCLDPWTPDGHLDPDEDGARNLTEYQIGSNPCAADYRDCDDDDSCTVDLFIGPTGQCLHENLFCDPCVPEQCPSGPGCKAGFYNCQTRSCQMVKLCGDQCCDETTNLCRIDCDENERDSHVIDIFEFGRGWVDRRVEDGIIEILGGGHVFGFYPFPVESGLLVFECQLTDPANHVAMIAFGHEVLWQSGRATPPDEWVVGAARVMHLAGETGPLIVALPLRSMNPSAASLRIRNIRVLSPEAIPRPGDFDEDGDTDEDDFAMFAPCITGPGGGVHPDCEPGDIDLDNDVDLDDFHLMQLEWSQ